MARILLVLEDINQMNSLKVTLSKLGCQVEILGVELGLKERLLSFRPDIVVTGGTGKKINPFSVSQKAKDDVKDVSIILLMATESSLTLEQLAKQRYDAVIQNSTDPLPLIKAINQINKRTKSVDLVEKYHKITAAAAASGNNVIRVLGQKAERSERPASSFGEKFRTSKDNVTRLQQYREMTSRIKVPAESTISKAEAQKRVAQLKKDWDPAALEEIDEAKRRFVKELFRKK
jgi:DNA-binding response OmpR family regulator